MKVAPTMLLLVSALALLLEAHGTTCIYCAGFQKRLSCHLGESDYEVIYELDTTPSAANGYSTVSSGQATVHACSTYGNGNAPLPYVDPSKCSARIYKDGVAYTFKRSTSGEPSQRVKTDCP